MKLNYSENVVSIKFDSNLVYYYIYQVHINIMQLI